MRRSRKPFGVQAPREFESPPLRLYLRRFPLPEWVCGYPATADLPGADVTLRNARGRLVGGRRGPGKGAGNPWAPLYDRSDPRTRRLAMRRLLAVVVVLGAGLAGASTASPTVVGATKDNLSLHEKHGIQTLIF